MAVAEAVGMVCPDMAGCGKQLAWKLSYGTTLAYVIL
jgi:hypothetical protein